MIGKEKLIESLKEGVDKEKKILKELTSMFNSLGTSKDKEEKEMISSQIESLKKSLKNENGKALQTLKGVYLAKPLIKTIVQTQPQKKDETLIQKSEKNIESSPRKRVAKMGDLGKELKLLSLEKQTLKRLKKKDKKVVKVKDKKPDKYLEISSMFFSKFSEKFVDKKIFKTLGRNLIKSNLPFIPNAYISLIFFTTLLSLFFAFFIFLFFLFFNFGVELPIITKSVEPIASRFLKVFWILIFVPSLTFFVTYIYPSLERKSTEAKINVELPFATINMSAISGSLIDPSKIFKIIILTGEYPTLSKEFTKIINEINIQGYNFVNALRNAAFNSPSKKLSELLGGLATTINSGGDLPGFFDERSKSLLFEHRLDMEKQSKAAETFMDIYISVVVAAPMILMLLLMMMKISGLGVSFSTGTITIIMLLGVTVINIVFMTFLHLKKGD